MSVSVTRNLERERVRRFVSYWDELLELLPEARRQAVEAAGEAIQQSLEDHIQRADLDGAGAKGRVKSWQELRLGSEGGWAAISPSWEKVESWEKRKTYAGRFKQHTSWVDGKKKPVTAQQVTTWLERGHGTRWGGYAPGRYFYSRTKDDALELWLKAADRVLCRLADEVEL